MSVYLRWHPRRLPMPADTHRRLPIPADKLVGMTAKYTLILLRHGNSVWNQENLFTGWVDVELSDQGRAEAQRAGELLKESGLKPDLLFTSRLRRAINTAHIALNAADRAWIDVVRDWRLNERHYGALQGKDKAQTLAEYGAEQFQTWRRSYDVPPPPIDDNDQYSQAHDERYADLGDNSPKTECLKDVLERMSNGHLINRLDELLPWNWRPSTALN